MLGDKCDEELDERGVDLSFVKPPKNMGELRRGVVFGDELDLGGFPWWLNSFSRIQDVKFEVDNSTDLFLSTQTTNDKHFKCL